MPDVPMRQFVAGELECRGHLLIQADAVALVMGVVVEAKAMEEIEPVRIRNECCFMGVLRLL